jgi:hypothetical protein
MRGVSWRSWASLAVALACAACEDQAACPAGTRKLGSRCAELARDAGDTEDGDAAEDADGHSQHAGEDAGDNEPPGPESGADEDAGMEQRDSGSPVAPISSPLLDLTVSAGALNPAFSSSVTEYRVPVDVTVQTVTVIPKVPPGATATIKDNAIDLAAGWTSGVLNLGDNRITIVVTHEGSPSSTYVLTVTRGFQQAYVKASNTGAGDAFGTSIAIAGDVLVVGAPYEDSSAYGVNGSQEDDATAQDSGAAYVFRRVGGVWEQTEYLKATNTEAGDHFGASVAISSGYLNGKPPGEIIVVGAPGEDGGSVGANGDQSSNSAADSGAAYVYGVARGVTYLKCGARVVDPGDACGTSVAVWHDWIALGAPGEDGARTGISDYERDNDAPDSGAVFLYRCAGGAACASSLEYIKASNTGAQDRFGQGVALSGVVPDNGAEPTSATLVVGAPGEDGYTTGVGGDGSIDLATSQDSGAAYAFSLGLGTGQLAYIKANHVGVGYAFGSAVAASEELIVIGAPHESGSAVGVNGRGDNTSASSGAAYVYTKNANTVTFSAYLKATNTGPQDLFGTSVSVSENTILVGAPGEDSSAPGVGGNQLDNSSSNAGAAYTYESAGGTWVPQAYFKPHSPAAQDGFGSSVAISQGTVVIAAASEDKAATRIDSPAPANELADASGAVYVFR